MRNNRNHPANNFNSWEKILRNEIIPEGLRSGKIRLLSSEEIKKSPCLVSSNAPKNPTGTHASNGYPGGRKAWYKAFECWFKTMTYDSLLGTLRRPYQHAARLGIELPEYKNLHARKKEAEEVQIYCWPEHYGMTIWRRPTFEMSKEDWEDIVCILAAEIKYRREKGSGNPYEDANISKPIKRIRDWNAVVNLSRNIVLQLKDPWNHNKWIKYASDAIWKVNRLSNPRARIILKTGEWDEFPNIVVPSPSKFNNSRKIHLKIEKDFLNSVERYEKFEGKKLDRVIKKSEEIVKWWNRTCSISKNDLIKQSEKISELWKEAENKVREHYGFPRIGEGWISEVELLNMIQDVFPKERIIHHERPKWLGRQHLDIFLPEKNIAIEYHGEQHFEPIDFFGGWEGLYQTQKRDKKKYELCSKNGITLIYFNFDEKITRELVMRRINEVLES